MKKFIKEKYNILIPVFLIIVILIAVFLYTREYKNNRYAKTEEVDVYQYFSGLKLEYKAKISRNKKNVILKYEPKDEVVNLSSIPIYIKGKDNIRKFDAYFGNIKLNQITPIMVQGFLDEMMAKNMSRDTQS